MHAQGHSASRAGVVVISTMCGTKTHKHTCYIGCTRGGLGLEQSEVNIGLSYAYRIAPKVLRKIKRFGLHANIVFYSRKMFLARANIYLYSKKIETSLEIRRFSQTSQIDPQRIPRGLCSVVEGLLTLDQCVIRPHNGVAYRMASNTRCMKIG